MVKPLDELTDQMNRYNSSTYNEIHSFQKIGVPSCRLLEWCCLLALSFCHRIAANHPPVNWRVLQDRKWIRNAPGVNPLWVQGTAFASCIFSSSVDATTGLSKQPARKKIVCTGGKKTKPPLHDSSCTHCNIMPLTRLLSPSLANSRCLVKSVRRVTRLSWLHVWTPSCGSWPQLVTAQAGAETCQSEGSQWQAVYLQSQAWGDRGEGKEGHANTEKKGCPLGRLEVAWGVI